MFLFGELRRRNVIRVTTAYVVTAWLIIQVAETVLPFFGFSDGAIRNVIVLLVIGFVPAVVFSWTFQLTAEGLKRDRGDREFMPDPGATRLLDRVIIVVLVIGISYFAFDKFVLAPERAAEREAEVAQQAKSDAIAGYYGDLSIAVMPFDNMSADAEQDYFVDGIAEELLHLLAKIRQLRVISRSSSFALRDLHLEIPEIAERLNVAHVLEGSVRKMGDTVRVTVKLIEARTDTQLWSENYDHKLANVFAIQDEIARDVARQLKIQLLRALPASRMVDPEAVALTQQARMIGERQPPDAGIKMTEFIDRAIELDPNYVSAWEVRAWTAFQLMGDGLISEEDARQRYQTSRRRILELDPENELVQVTDGFNAMIAGRYEDAAALLEQSISRSPNDVDAAVTGGALARMMGKFDVATRLGEHAVAIGPLCFHCLWQLSRTYLFAGEYDAALETRNRYLALGEGGEYHYGLILLLQGKPDEALEHYQALGPDIHKRAGLAMAYHDLGEQSSAEDELTRLMPTENDQTELLVAEVAAWMGKRDVAFEWLNKAADRVPAWELRLMNPVFRNLHDDPRWNEFLESVGFSSERLDAIKFDPALPQ